MRKNKLDHKKKQHKKLKIRIEYDNINKNKVVNNFSLHSANE